MNRTVSLLALAGACTFAIGLSACQKPAPIVVSPAPEAVPGPAGPQGATGATGTQGNTGSPGSSTTVIVPAPAASAASS